MFIKLLQMVCCLMSDIPTTPKPTDTHILRNKRNVSNSKVSSNGKTERNEMILNLHLQRKTTFQMPHQIFAIQSKQGKMHHLKPSHQMPSPSSKTIIVPSTEINVSWNICSKYFRKHLRHKCHHQISNRTKYLSNISNII